VLKNFQRFLQTGEIKKKESSPTQTSITTLPAECKVHSEPSTTKTIQNELNELLRSTLQTIQVHDSTELHNGFKVNSETLWKRRGHFTTGEALAIAARQIHSTTPQQSTDTISTTTTTTTSQTTTTTTTTTTTNSISNLNPSSSQTPQQKKQKSEIQSKKIKELALEIANKIINEMTKKSSTGKYSFELSETGAFFHSFVFFCSIGFLNFHFNQFFSFHHTLTEDETHLLRTHQCACEQRNRKPFEK
jgi:hypothetical protein